MATQQDVVEWARTAELSTPIRFGDVEARVMAGPLPKPKSVSAGSVAARGSAGIVMAVATLLAFGAPVISLGIIAAHAYGNDPVTTGSWLPIARIALTVTIALPFAMLAIWWLARDRHRGVIGLLVTSGTAVLAVIIFFVLRDMPDLQGATELSTRALLAMVAGVAVFVAMLVASKPGPAPKDRSREGVNTVSDKQVLDARREVLNALSDRGLVTDEIFLKAIQMPLGSWRELDHHG